MFFSVLLYGITHIHLLFFKDKSRNLSQIVSVLRSASVERFDVSRMRDFSLCIMDGILSLPLVQQKGAESGEEMGREILASEESPSGESPLDNESNLTKESASYNESALNRESALCSESAPGSESAL